MDWITFASKAIDALAWPLVALILGLFFRKKLLDLIPQVRKFKAGPLEAEFELATKEVLVTANQATSMAKSARPAQNEVATAGDRPDVLTRFLDARNDPAGVILRGWASVDSELFRLGLQLEILGDAKASSSRVFEAVMGTEVLPSETSRLVRELRELRNQVAHAKVVPSVEAAQDYLLAVDRVVELIHAFRKNLPRYVSPER